MTVTTNSISFPDLDALRRDNPDLGFGLFALEAGGPVTLEVYTPDGGVFSWQGPTAADCLTRAFPDAVVLPAEEPAVASDEEADVADMPDADELPDLFS